MNGGGAQRVKDVGRSTASRSLVPGKDRLHKIDLDDAQAPLQILGPSRDGRWKRRGDEANDSLRLEVSTQRESIGSDVGGGILMAQAGHQSRRREGQACDDAGSPFDGDEVDRLAVGYGGLNTGDGSPVGLVDKDLDLGVDVGKGIGNARDLGLCARIDLDVEGVIEIAGAHRTEAQEAIASGARVDALADDVVAVCGNSEVEDDIPLHGGGGGHVHGQRVVVGGVDNIEQAGGKAGIVLAGTERGGVEERVLGGRGGEQLGEEHEAECEGRPLRQSAWKAHRGCVDV